MTPSASESGNLKTARERIDEALNKLFAQYYSGREAADFRRTLRRNVTPILEAALGQAVAQARVDGPKIVCLCGSGRFMDQFNEAEFQETLAGHIVLTIGCNTKDIARTASLSQYKPMLDELHKRKIDLADEVFVLNVGGYIGESTRSEIDYAIAHNKPVRYLERDLAAIAKEKP